MNVRPPIEPSNPTSVLSVAFNHDSSCFSVGLESGICIFHTKSCLLKASRDFNAGVGLVRMMGTTNYLALVGGGKSPKFAMNKAIIWDDMKGKVALEIGALSAIRGVLLGRERIVLVLQNSVRVYSFAKPPDLLHVYETADNHLGLCSMSGRKLAFPGRTVGQIQLVELATGNVSIIPAHSSALKAVQLSLDGELLASASETGTLIRVYSTANCAKLAELRRGIDPATIFSLAFSPSGALLACTSDKATLHIFDVPHPRRQPTSYRGGNNNNNSSSSSSTQKQQQQQQQHLHQQQQSLGAAPLLPPPPPDAEPGKWGILSKIPLMPRMFSDVYSFASIPFEAGAEGMIGGIPFSEGAVLGTSRPPKGVIGWLSEDSLAVVGAGQDARWEKFVIVDGDDGKRHCVREGWKRYLGNT